VSSEHRNNDTARFAEEEVVPTKSLLRIYDSYLEKLRAAKAELAALQLTGKLEDRLTKEFASCVYACSAGDLIALSNVGKKGEQKIDIGVLQGDFSKAIDRRNASVRALVEAKYLRNAHKLCLGNAQDEIVGTLKDLRRQLWTFNRKEWGGFPVRLSGQRRDIYGLVLVSYVRPNDEPDGEGTFLERIRTQAKQLGFTYNDLSSTPWLQRVYDRVPVVALKRSFSASLKAGLWRATKPPRR
jgi:hypothetical protein